MTIGVGGSSREQALAALQDMTARVVPIALPEYRQRIASAQQRMRELGIGALYLHAGTSLNYFTGLQWHPSERMVGAIVPCRGEVQFIAPWFELGTVRDFMVLEGEVHSWHEHESPYQLLAGIMRGLQLDGGLVLAIDGSTPFFTVDGITKSCPEAQLIDARDVITWCRMCKSQAELALMQRAKDMTLAVHKAAASILHEGITTTEVQAFIQQAHRKVGASGSTFCIVLFGGATAFPHGVKEAQTLRTNDMVLIDTGCALHGYLSDITRTYVFGTPNERQRQVWNAEKAAQAAAFAAAQIGTCCGDVDIAVRKQLASDGFGPGYLLPGLPHRTGHGIGLDLHEAPYLVSSDDTPLAPGMCFSNEPMICVPGEFGVRLEDHFYMTKDGPRWFTAPCHSIDDPFGYVSHYSG
ncbi:Xaa-Pro peptidase family protein [Crenobacter sp. SG2305]|uniref:M24 family metallopeptidase n=1 Tax=Crenobacter oryzisoli TaxID=3056844 RepID=UPI0025AA3D28|nr:Xaa-Pro peptidase family protein [Crenobacter sp. SG2305]MDN0083949.1 Xaa-Pro peptidase family protein [Crenobacter sp. SG2305]